MVECQLVNEDFPEDRSAKEIKHLIGKCLFVLLNINFAVGDKDISQIHFSLDEFCFT